ncbi:hypothetical protein WJX84_001911 [Apatococcus fuscideae]|uniref:Uncharacterized protein n=1 Tax=Apatococcus fuscideae TaxID=2026836 RepID=A0AAW1SSF3_9CHLO
MWNQLSSFAADIRERAEHVARDAGLEDQVSRARQQVDALAGSVLSLEPSPTKDGEGPDRGSPLPPRRQVSGAFLLPETDVAQDETERSNGDDGWDMDDIPLGDGQVSSPEPAAAQSSSSPLRSQRPAADKLSGDAQLQTRIAALEKEIRTCQADLQDSKERIRVERQGKTAAQKDLRESKAKLRVLEQNLQRTTQQAESLQTEVDEVARELQLGKKGVDAAENALQAQQDEADSLRRQLADAVMGRGPKAVTAQPSAAAEDSQAAALMTAQLAEAQVMESALREENAALKECLRSFSAVTPVKAAGPASPSEASPGLENGHGEAGLLAPSPLQSPSKDDDPEKTELKAKLNKTKRTALGYKSKLADALAAKDEALAELAALKGQPDLARAAQPQGADQASADPASRSAPAAEAAAGDAAPSMPKPVASSSAGHSANSSVQAPDQSAQALQAARDEVSRLHLQIASMQQQLTAATAACSVSEQESQQLRANAVQSQLGSAQAARMQAAEEVSDLAQQTTETAKRLDKLIEALERATAERDLARKQLLIVPDGAAPGIEEIASLRTSLTDLQQNLKSARSQAAASSSLSGDLQTAREDMQRLRQEFKAARSAADASKAMIASEATAESPEAPVTPSSRPKSASMDVVASSPDGTKLNVLEKYEQLLQVQGELHDAEGEVTKLTAQVASCEAKMAALAAERDAVSSQANELQQELVHQKEAALCAESLEQSQSAAQHAEAQLHAAQLQSSLQAALQESAEHQAALHATQAELQQKSTDLDLVQSTLLQYEQQQGVAAEQLRTAKLDTDIARSALARAQQQHAEELQAAQALDAAGKAKVAAITLRLRDVEGRAAAAQQEAESAGIELQDLQQRYRAEREASGQELADAQMDFQQALKDVKEIAGLKARAAAEEEAAKLQAELQARLDQQSAELDTAQQQVGTLQEALDEAASVRADRDAAVQDVNHTRSELEAAQAQLSGAQAAQLSAEAAAKEAQTAMSERQKRFQHVHAKLKKDEDALKARVERFEAEAAGYGEQIGAALQQADAAVQVKESLLLRLQQAEAQMSSSTAQLDAAQAAASGARQEAASATAALRQLQAQHASRVSQLEADLSAAEDRQQTQSRQAAESHIEEQVTARLADRQRKLEQLRAEASAAVVAADAKVVEAQQRADNAELAKIELSLRLAQLAGDQDTDLPEPSPSKQPLASADEALALETGALLQTAELEALQKRVEEAELAASVGARRASSAEGEVSVLKRQLVAAEKKLKELAWQVKMISDPQQIGGRGSQQAGATSLPGSQSEPGRVNNILDMFGCGANYTRR